MIAAAVLVLLFQAAAPAPAASPMAAATVTVARGSVTSGIVCAADPRFTYALYLPKEYRPERAWPILYVYDPRGRGTIAAELFAEAAAAHGFVVASSNDTRSDDPAAPNAAAVTALWVDTHSRISIDPKRRYAAGFSGTGRVAVRLGITQKGSVAGVIAVGSRLTEEVKAKEAWPFAFFGAMGEDDFNNPEMWRLDDLLARNGTPHRVVSFDGGHEWMPRPMAMEALDWFALRSGSVDDGDAAVVERYRAAVSARADALEAAGRVGDSLRLWQGLAEDLGSNGPASAGSARENIQRLGDPARRDLERVRKQIDRDRAWIDAANARVVVLVREELPALPRLLREFEVEALRKQSSATDPVLSHSAARRLSSVATSAGYYIPEHLKREGRLGDAARWYELAAAIDPEDASPHLGLARVHARAGNRKSALDALRTAVRLGPRIPRRRIAEDPELATLVGDPAFAEILKPLP